MSDSENKLEAATGFIKNIPEFMDAISGVLQTPYGWLILAGIVVWFLINKDLSNVFCLLERGEKMRLEKLEKYITNEANADDGALKVIKDLRDAYYFKVATGVYAEKNLRCLLIKLHDETSHVISWTKIKRALPFIEAESDLSPSIRSMTKSEKMGYYYNIFVGVVSLIFSSAILLTFFVSQTKSIDSVLYGVGGALCGALFAMIVFSQNWPYNSAKQIKVELDNK